MEKSIFTQIIDREIPAKIHYEDDQFIAFDDIQPMAPVHVLIVPKKPYKTLEAVDLDDREFYANLLTVVRKVAKKLGIAANYKIFMNVGDRVQAVPHLHLHLTGGWGEKLSTRDLDRESAKLINS